MQQLRMKEHASRVSELPDSLQPQLDHRVVLELAAKARGSEEELDSMPKLHGIFTSAGR